MGLPTCRPLPRSHYDADSRGRCTNLSATPLTRVCVCLLRQNSVSGGQVLPSLSLSSFLSLPLSLFLFLSPLAISPTVFFPPIYPPTCTSPSLSFVLPLLSLSIRLSSSTSLHAAVPCCSVVSSRGTSTILPD